MSIEVKHFLPYSPATIWAIVGSPGRVDWVPGVASCEFDGEVRRFKMEGAGGLAERIVSHDDAQMFMEYSVVESIPPLKSHLASIKLNPQEGDTAQGTEFVWCTDVAPVEVEPFIKKGMLGSLALLEQILAAENSA
ncbi:SRPBCC family protein [Pseudomonadales bacterium]|nr:SRPBCC family protein [Pseudomonadales bacterium]